VGRLILSARVPGESFSVSDRKLLDDLARQAAVTVYAARLNADLQKSRERLVTAREEERRRLRRDLHDGLGPRLAAQTLKAGSARLLYERDAEAADALLSDLESDIEATLTEIRRLVYDLRPPALDELGLVGTLRDTAERHTAQTANGLAVLVHAPDELPPLSAAVEVAAYRIVQEALANVTRHAAATECLIRISVARELEIEVSDNGVGIPVEHRAGVGLHSMRERAEELGGSLAIGHTSTGGTKVLARLPLPDHEKSPPEG
jgi:signal transduction histidine kinase